MKPSSDEHIPARIEMEERGREERAAFEQAFSVRKGEVYYEAGRGVGLLGTVAEMAFIQGKEGSFAFVLTDDEGIDPDTEEWMPMNTQGVYVHYSSREEVFTGRHCTIKNESNDLEGQTLSEYAFNLIRGMFA